MPLLRVFLKVKEQTRFTVHQAMEGLQELQNV